ncbi:MAG: carboxypeptidase-like regulatory domain-containing protein [Planctomycetota bacterium]
MRRWLPLLLLALLAAAGMYRMRSTASEEQGGLGPPPVVPAESPEAAEPAELQRSELAGPAESTRLPGQEVEALETPGEDPKAPAGFTVQLELSGAEGREVRVELVRGGKGIEQGTVKPDTQHSFTGLESGLYQVLVRTQDEPFLISGWHQFHLFGAPRTLRVQIPVLPAPVLEASVSDPDGLAIAGAEVVWLGWSGFEDLAPRTTSDALGRVRLPLLPQHDYHLRVGKAGYTSVEAAGFTGTDATRVVEWTLEPAPVVKGTVFAPGGAPAVGADLEVYSDRLRWSGFTDRDGGFVAEGVPSGAFVLIAHAGVDGNALIARVEVGAQSSREGLVIELQASLHVKGRFVDSAGAPVPFEFIRLIPDTDRGGWYSSGEGTTDAQGAFDIGGLFPGPYRVEFGRFSRAVHHLELTPSNQDEFHTIQVPAR